MQEGQADGLAASIYLPSTCYLAAEPLLSTGNLKELGAPPAWGRGAMKWGRSHLRASSSVGPEHVVSRPSLDGRMDSSTQVGKRSGAAEG